MNILNNYLQSIFRKQEKGFTLIELLVVILFIAALSAIALPTYLNQVGKSRESESQMIIGGLNRSQQAYHFEKGKFASQIELLGIGFKQKYHTFQLSGILTTDYKVEVRHSIEAVNSSDSRVRNYALGIFFDQGQYTAVQCQGYDVGTSVQVTIARECSNGGVKLY
jgi:type IV pilus assembly protein PilA